MDVDKFFSLSKTIRKKVCIYGAGEIGSFWGFLIVKGLKVNLECYIDNWKNGTCNGLEIHNSAWLLERKSDYFVFVAVEGKTGEEICESLSENGVKDFFWICEGGDEWLSEIGDYLEKTDDIELRNSFNDFYDDKEYLRARFKRRMGYYPDLQEPKTFNEKINWLKLNDHNPKYTIMADKFEVKKFVSGQIGEEYVIPILGVWEDFDSIDFEKLPNQFVLKCTHDSGSVVICRNKESFDKDYAKKKLEKRLKMNYFWPDREWVYKGVKQRIIAEKFVSDGHDDLIPYKIFCFMGKPKIIQVIQGDKTSNESIDYFDEKWNLLDLRQNFPNSQNHISKPNELIEMLKLASKLSKGIPFVRVDFYVIYGHVIFSEFTFYSDSGAERFYPDEWDRKLGDLIGLEEVCQ